MNAAFSGMAEQIAQVKALALLLAKEGSHRKVVQAFQERVAAMEAIVHDERRRASLSVNRYRRDDARILHLELENLHLRDKLDDQYVRLCAIDTERQSLERQLLSAKAATEANDSASAETTIFALITDTTACPTCGQPELLRREDDSAICQHCDGVFSIAFPQ